MNEIGAAAPCDFAPHETPLVRGAAASQSQTARGRVLGWRRLATALARPPLWCTLSVCALILCARRPDLVRNPQFWAEDGPVFFLQSRTMGIDALFEPSAGYLHTVMRLIAGGATWFDPTLAPFLYVAAAMLLTLYVAARTQSGRFPLPPSIGYALAVVLVPEAYEVLLTLTNLQWVLAGGLLVVLLSREPRTYPQCAHDVTAVILLGLTGPFVVALWPLFAWRWWRRRTRFSLLLGALSLGCALVQGWFIGKFSSGATSTDIAPEMLLAVTGARVGGSLLAGGWWRMDAGIGIWAIVGVATLAAVLGLAWRRGAARTERWWLAAAFVVLLAAALFRCRDVLPALFQGAGMRYFYPLQLIVLWLLIAATKARSRVIARSAAAALVIGAVTNASRLREAPLADFQWAGYAARIRNGEATAVRLNPDWEFVIPGSINAPALLPPTGGHATFVNVSTRCRVSRNDPASVSFVLGEGPPRGVLLRAIGPSLARFGVQAPAAEPALRLLRDGRGDVDFAALRNGADNPAIVRAAARCAAFPLEHGTADVSALVVLAPGTYTAIVSSGDEVPAEVLLEIYDVPGGG